MEREIRDLQAIASVYRKRGKPQLAAEILKTAADMQKTVLGPSNMEVAKTLYELGEVYCDLERFDDARQVFEEAVRIWGIHHPEAAQDLLNFTNALVRLQEQSESER